MNTWSVEHAKESLNIRASGFAGLSYRVDRLSYEAQEKLGMVTMTRMNKAFMQSVEAGYE